MRQMLYSFDHLKNATKPLYIGIILLKIADNFCVFVILSQGSNIKGVFRTVSLSSWMDSLQLNY